MYFQCIFLVLVAVEFKSVTPLTRLFKETSGFQFPDAAPPTGSGGGGTFDVNVGAGNDGLTRQNIVNGSLVGLISNLTTNQITNVVPAIVNGGTCICVPTGQCATNVTTGTTDGSGQIDIRIVTNLIPPPVGTIINSTTGTILTPATCQANILQRCCQNGGYSCGVRYPPVIGSATPAAGQAAYGEYPWQAVLLGPGDIYAGAGALIDNFHVLTAAHRVTDYQTSGRALKVRLGEWDASSASEPIQSQEFTVSRIFVHPSYNAVNLKNDVALLRLSTQVVLGQTPTITTACLPATTFVGSRCWVAGWGKNDFLAGQYQAIQKEVDVPVLSQDICQNSLRNTRLGASFIFDTQSFMCAGGEAGKDACTGDGGSPLMCELGGRNFVVGLVAWGIGCATGGVPGVYVNVASYVPWIQTTTRSP